MNSLIHSLSIIVNWLENQKIDYMVIGGVANSYYGNSRQTIDIDLKIKIEESLGISGFIKELQKIAFILPDNPIEFTSETNVIPVKIDKIRVDIILAQLPYEIEAISRSNIRKLFNVPVKMCKIEDLIIQKAVSSRNKDWDDIRTLISINKKRINWMYLLKHCKDLSEFLSRNEIIKKITDYKNAE